MPCSSRIRRVQCIAMTSVQFSAFAAVLVLVLAGWPAVVSQPQVEYLPECPSGLGIQVPGASLSGQCVESAITRGEPISTFVADYVDVVVGHGKYVDPLMRGASLIAAACIDAVAGPEADGCAAVSGCEGDLCAALCNDMACDPGLFEAVDLSIDVADLRLVILPDEQFLELVLANPSEVLIAGANVTTRAYFDQMGSVYRWDVTNATINPSGDATLRLPWPGHLPGTYEAEVVLDSGHRIVETNEFNNLARASVTAIRDPTGPPESHVRVVPTGPNLWANGSFVDNQTWNHQTHAYLANNESYHEAAPAAGLTVLPTGITIDSSAYPAHDEVLIERGWVHANLGSFQSNAPFTTDARSDGTYLVFDPMPSTLSLKPYPLPTGQLTDGMDGVFRAVDGAVRLHEITGARTNVTEAITAPNGTLSASLPSSGGPSSLRLDFISDGGSTLHIEREWLHGEGQTVQDVEWTGTGSTPTWSLHEDHVVVQSSGPQNGTLVFVDRFPIGADVQRGAGSFGRVLEDEDRSDSIVLVAQRSDLNHSSASFPLGSPTNALEDFAFSYEFEVEDPGNWQSAIPFMLTNGTISPDAANESAFFMVLEPSAAGTDSRIAFQFTDSDGRQLLDKDTMRGQTMLASTGVPYTVNASYYAEPSIWNVVVYPTEDGADLPVAAFSAKLLPPGDMIRGGAAGYNFTHWGATSLAPGLGTEQPALIRVSDFTHRHPIWPEEPVTITFPDLDLEEDHILQQGLALVTDIASTTLRQARPGSTVPPGQIRTFGPSASDSVHLASAEDIFGLSASGSMDLASAEDTFGSSASDSVHLASAGDTFMQVIHLPRWDLGIGVPKIEVSLEAIAEACPGGSDQFNLVANDAVLERFSASRAFSTASPSWKTFAAPSPVLPGSVLSISIQAIDVDPTCGLKLKVDPKAVNQGLAVIGGVIDRRPGGGLLAVVISDDDGPENLPPSACFTVKVIGPEATVNAECSPDPEGLPLQYFWDWGDGQVNPPAAAPNPGSTQVTTKPSPTPGAVAESHIYTTTGPHTIRLTVQDVGRLRDSTTRSASTAVGINNPPQACFTYTVRPLQVEVDGSCSSDPDGDPIGYAWRWGDGKSSSNVVSTVHDYGTRGLHEVSLTVSDGLGGTHTQTQQVDIPPANHPPNSCFGVQISGYTAQAWSCAWDKEDGSAITRHWDWGDGTTSSAKDPSHTYGSAGNRPIRLDVTDSWGASETESRTVSVPFTNSPPTACFTTESGDFKVVWVDAGCSSDPDGQKIQTTIDWGDGTTHESIWRFDGDYRAHKYDWARSYTIRVTITDTYGESSMTTKTITVSGGNLHPVGCFIVSGMSDRTVEVDGSCSYDREGLDLTYEWDWGDGTISSGGPTNSHTYASYGTYTTILTVTDPSGDTGVDGETFDVEATPVASFTITQDPSNSRLVHVDASAAYDPDGDPLTRYRWDWGDGFQESTTGPIKAHEYSCNTPLPTTFTIGLVVFDTEGNYGSTTRTSPTVSDSDTDADGLSDCTEVARGTDPYDSDSDDDGWSDGEEVNTYLTKPNDPHTDTDSVPDPSDADPFGNVVLDMPKLRAYAIDDVDSAAHKGPKGELWYRVYVIGSPDYPYEPGVWKDTPPAYEQDARYADFGSVFSGYNVDDAVRMQFIEIDLYDIDKYENSWVGHPDNGNDLLDISSGDSKVCHLMIDLHDGSDAWGEDLPFVRGMTPQQGGYRNCSGLEDGSDPEKEPSNDPDKKDQDTDDAELWYLLDIRTVNEDRLPYYYELDRQHLATFDVKAPNDDMDEDGDGFTNYQEFQFDTDSSAKAQLGLRYTLATTGFLTSQNRKDLDAAFERASQVLYDATDGYMAIAHVTYRERVAETSSTWKSADVKFAPIFADIGTHEWWPHACFRHPPPGYICGRPDGGTRPDSGVYMPTVFGGVSLGSHEWWAQTLAHEILHLEGSFVDEYNTYYSSSQGSTDADGRSSLGTSLTLSGTKWYGYEGSDCLSIMGDDPEAGNDNRYRYQYELSNPGHSADCGSTFQWIIYDDNPTDGTGSAWRYLFDTLVGSIEFDLDLNGNPDSTFTTGYRGLEGPRDNWGLVMTTS